MKQLLSLFGDLIKIVLSNCTPLEQPVKINAGLYSVCACVCVCMRSCVCLSVCVCVRDVHVEKNIFGVFQKRRKGKKWLKLPVDL